MARIAFPSYDVQTVNGHAGGVGSFITHFARQLIARGDEVTIIHTWGDERLVPVDHTWREQYRTWGIKLIELPNAAIPHRFPDVCIACESSK